MQAVQTNNTNIFEWNNKIKKNWFAIIVQNIQTLSKFDIILRTIFFELLLDPKPFVLKESQE